MDVGQDDEDGEDGSWIVVWDWDVGDLGRIMFGVNRMKKMVRIVAVVEDGVRWWKLVAMVSMVAMVEGGE